ncbi:MAG TPA: hypothetical protein VNQ53_08520 [Nocardioides sp.]|nr:hypothetical protein [Nocardioides sp.]
MNDLTIQKLEDALQGGDREPLDGDTLASIRRRGGRRRTTQRALTGLGTAVLVGAVGLTLAITATGDERTSDNTSVADDPREQETPTELSPLAQRALREIPGAVQVSDWQIVLPAPDARSRYWQGENQVDRQVVGDTVPLDAKSYQGVTMFSERAWPGWLYQGTLDFEQSLKDEDGSYPVGSLDNGIMVEVGAAELACVSWEGDSCGPAKMTRSADGELHFESGMGTDDFLTPGSEMEVFLTDDYSTGSPGELAFAGLPGTDVARADFVTTSGEVVAGHVHSGLVEGASMMSARVPGRLAKVVAYDASGEVIEDHPLAECDSPVECEVR